MELSFQNFTLLGQLNKEKYEMFNLGTGNGYSVMDVIKSFESSTGVKLNYKIVGRREGDVEQVYADTTLANEVLGWKAQLTIDEMTFSHWNFEKTYRDSQKAARTDVDASEPIEGCSAPGGGAGASCDRDGEL